MVPQSDEMPKVWIHADESCLGNQFRERRNPGGAAGLVEFWHGDRWARRDYWIAEPDTTNNRMAIRSAIEPLRALSRACRVRFISDSQYLVKAMTEWLEGWKRRGWKRKGGAVENLELWKELDGEAARHRVDWRWVRGHAGHPENEYAHHLAIRAARAQSSSGGLVESGFESWLRNEREEKERYVGYHEFTSPAERWGRDASS